jgi:uncharacterized membrane protein
MGGSGGSPLNNPSPPIPQNVLPAVHRVLMHISSILRIGVTLSLLTILAGTVISFLHHPDYLQGKTDKLSQLTNPGYALPHSASDALTGLKEGRGQSLVLLGLLLLLATPVMRVAISIFAFLFQKDWIFTLFTTIVLALLLLSFVLGRAE